MREGIPSRTRPVDFSIEAKEILGVQGLVENVHGRFNLSFEDEKTQDFVLSTEDGSKRYLTAPFNELSLNMGRIMAEASIEQLEVAGGNEELVVYGVPSHAKPLLNERLFPERTSTSTYISDEELFENLGKMWRRIFNATSRLPEGTILGHTGMKDFSGESQQFFPIPPYNNWEELTAEESPGFFSKNIKNELVAIYPNTPVTGLCNAADRAFRKG